MAKTKDIRIIKEIKSKIRIIEKGEEPEEIKKEKEEELEDMVSDAPSAREFPEFLGRQKEQETAQLQSEAMTPSATTEEESKKAVKYQIQGNITEEEISRIYRTEAGVKPMPTMLSTPEHEGARRTGFESRELESVRTRDEESKYKISFEPEKQVKKRKYPWEA